MARMSGSVESPSRAEVVEVILNKGIVIEAWIAISLVGLRLLDVEATVLIASLDTYLNYADGIGKTMIAA